MNRELMDTSFISKVSSLWCDLIGVRTHDLLPERSQQSTTFSFLAYTYSDSIKGALKDMFNARYQKFDVMHASSTVHSPRLSRSHECKESHLLE